VSLAALLIDSGRAAGVLDSFVRRTNEAAAEASGTPAG